MIYKRGILLGGAFSGLEFDITHETVAVAVAVPMRFRGLWTAYKDERDISKTKANRPYCRKEMRKITRCIEILKTT